MVNFLNSCARATVLIMKKELQTMGKDDGLWSSVPPEMKAKYFPKLEEMAKTHDVPLDRCVNHWMAQALMRDCYANSGKKRTVKERKEVCSKRKNAGINTKLL